MPTKEELITENEQLKAQIEAQQANGDSDETLAELTAKVEALEGMVVEKEETITLLESKVARLSPKAAANADKNAPVITLDEEAYQIVSNVFLPGFGKLTRDEIAENEEAALKLLELKSSALKKL